MNPHVSVLVAMGETISTIKDNPLLLRLVGSETVPEEDEFWNQLLAFAYSPPMPPANQSEARMLDEALSPLVDSLIKHNPATRHLRTLVRLLLVMMADLKDEAKCQR